MTWVPLAERPVVDLHGSVFNSRTVPDSCTISGLFACWATPVVSPMPRWPKTPGEIPIHVRTKAAIAMNVFLILLPL